jgi:hypothetical protein
MALLNKDAKGLFGPMHVLPASAPRDDKVKNARAYALHGAFVNGAIGAVVGFGSDYVLARTCT